MPLLIGILIILFVPMCIKSMEVNSNKLPINLSKTMKCEVVEWKYNDKPALVRCANAQTACYGNKEKGYNCVSERSDR